MIWLSRLMEKIKRKKAKVVARSCSFLMSVPVKYNNNGGPGMPILVVNAPETPPTMKSLIGVPFILNLHINNNVNNKRRTLTTNFITVILLNIKIVKPNGRPTILPNEILFNSALSISFRIFQTKIVEMINDKIMFICIASCGRNSISKNGVAITEKPKPVLACNIEATNIIQMKIAIVPKTIPLSNAVLITILSFLE